MATRDNYTFSNHDALPAAVRDTMVHLLKSWDDPHHNYDFVNDFKEDGVLRFGVDAKGKDAIKGMKDFLIHPENGPVVDLQHTFEKGFVMPGPEPGKQEFIGTAEVWYKLKNGRKVTCRPASHAVFVDVGGELKAEFYEVHMDSNELMAAIKEMQEADASK